MLALRIGKLTGAVLFLAGLVAGGCASSKYMREVTTPQPMTPRPGYAKVIFLRPSSFAAAIKFTILNHQGQFVGESLPDSKFPVDVPAGRHVFIVWAENTGALQATVAAGCTYFVEVAPKMGWGSARGHLLAIKPGTARWAKRDEWLRGTKLFLPDPAGGQAYVSSRAGDAAERVRRGMERLTKYDAAELADRTINPGDGICSGGQPAPARAAPAAAAPAPGYRAPPAAAPPPTAAPAPTTGAPPTAAPPTTPATGAPAADDSAKVWFYASGNTKQGPVSAAEIRNLFNNKQVESTTLVWKEGMGAWTHLCRVPELADLVKWFYAHGGKKLGPVTAVKLRQWVQGGNLNAQTLVWREGMPQWAPLGTLKEFADVRGR